MPSNETLSVGKVITWSGPAIAMDGLFPLQPSQEVSFLQEIKMNKLINKIKTTNFITGFIIVTTYLYTTLKFFAAVFVLLLFEVTVTVHIQNF